MPDPHRPPIQSAARLPDLTCSQKLIKQSLTVIDRVASRQAK